MSTTTEQVTKEGTVVVSAREELATKSWLIFTMRAQITCGELWWEHVELVARVLDSKSAAQARMERVVSEGKASEIRWGLRHQRCE